MGLFGRDTPPDPKEQVREWSRKMRHEMRQLDREVRGIQRKEDEVKRSLTAAAKKGDKDICKIYAKEIIGARKAVAKLYTSKAQINSVVMGMNHQLSTIRLAGSLQKSTEVMQSMQALVKVPEISETMRNLSREMMRAGIIEEMMDDTMEMMEPEGLEDEADAEVEKVLWELTKGELGKAPDVLQDSVRPDKVRTKQPAATGAQAEALEDPAEALGDMQARLESLRSS